MGDPSGSPCLFSFYLLLMFSVASNGGVGNRLRVLLTYKTIRERLGQPVPELVWQENKHCPANNGAYSLKGAKLVDRKPGGDTVILPGSVNSYVMFRSYDLPTPSFEELVAMYKDIQFSCEVEDRATSLPIACHIRQTDLTVEGKLEQFYDYLCAQKQHSRIHIACDDGATIEKLPRHLAYVNLSTFTDGDGRKTSTFDTAVDMLSCVNADLFVGTKESSFTTMIVMLRHARGKEDFILL